MLAMNRPVAAMSKAKTASCHGWWLKLKVTIVGRLKAANTGAISG
jgi:hypothetical protein